MKRKLITTFLLLGLTSCTTLNRQEVEVSRDPEKSRITSFSQLGGSTYYNVRNSDCQVIEIHEVRRGSSAVYSRDKDYSSNTKKFQDADIFVRECL
ncbi:MAG: hypothetical protein KKD94_01455 [Nanoarchaeota archaeon]|nr:hypothetical protein [Nanoarchaeota archaeon]